MTQKGEEENLNVFWLPEALGGTRRWGGGQPGREGWVLSYIGTNNLIFQEKSRMDEKQGGVLIVI